MNPYRLLRKLLWKASMVGLSRGPHITRYAMYRHLADLAHGLPNRRGQALSISHSERLLQVLGIDATPLTAANYPECNFLELGYPDGSFDFVVSDQVLEHVEGNPQRAVDESWRVLRPGGLAIHTTCFINPLHGAPKDFWRFTPEALALLHRNFSEIIDVGGWGNFAVWSLVRDGLRHAGVPHAAWHPMHRIATMNDPRWPIVTWVVARK
jgi:SAM-dependent methyltransferase